MDYNSIVSNLAIENGFDEVYIINTDEFARYKIDIDENNIDYAQQANPKDIMDSASAIIVMIKGYQPYDQSYFGDDHLVVDAYYVTANEYYHKTQNVADEIKRLGYRANGSPNIPYRHCAFRAGAGYRGVNGLLVNKKHGSYTNIQCILTDMPLDITDNHSEVDICSKCNKCIDICKAGAIDGSSIIVRKNCKRYYMPALVYVPQGYRDSIGSELIGCKLCRQVCPGNSEIEAIAPPTDLVNACYLPKLMDFDNNSEQVQTLTEYIGSNEARPMRLVKSMILIAGNTRDKKYVPLIQSIVARYNDDIVTEYAQWAIQRIKSK